MKNIKNITTQIQPLLEILKRYSVLIFVIAFVGMYSFLITRINSLTQSEPTVLSAEQQTIQRLKIDQEAVDKILELEEHNIEVKTLFEQARNNPFTE
jgi:hypothetical protein